MLIVCAFALQLSANRNTIDRPPRFNNKAIEPVCLAIVSFICVPPVCKSGQYATAKSIGDKSTFSTLPPSRAAPFHRASRHLPQLFGRCTPRGLSREVDLAALCLEARASAVPEKKTREIGRLALAIALVNAGGENSPVQREAA